MKKLIETEINTTAYILRTLQESIVQVSDDLTQQKKIFISISDPAKITGIWKNDSQYINITSEGNGTSRLIMGFGPSSSGKTFIAKEIIKAFKSTYNDDFSDHVISIDGGIYRETSIMYQYIIKIISLFRKITVYNKFKGLKNLVSAGFSIMGSIYDSSIIKKTIYEYLTSINIKDKRYSIYVPETLGSPLSGEKSYNKYIQLTGGLELI